MSVVFGPYTITRAELLPATRSASTPQQRVLADDGSVHVADSTYDEELLEIRMKDSLTTIENVVYFIRNGVRYSAIPFLMTDGFGVERLVRYWSGGIKWKHIGAELVELKVVVRVEV